MLGFDALLKFADENHRPVIVSLVGLLVIGGLGGGLLIQNLQTSFSQRNELEKQRIGVLNRTYAAQRESLRTQLNLLSDRADAYRLTFRLADEQLERIYEDLVKLQRTKGPLSKKAILKLEDELTSSRTSLAYLSERLKDTSARAEQEWSATATAPPTSTAPESSKHSRLSSFA